MVSIENVVDLELLFPQDDSCSLESFRIRNEVIDEDSIKFDYFINGELYNFVYRVKGEGYFRMYYKFDISRNPTKVQDREQISISMDSPRDLLNKVKKQLLERKDLGRVDPVWFFAYIEDQYVFTMRKPSFGKFYAVDLGEYYVKYTYEHAEYIALGKVDLYKSRAFYFAFNDFIEAIKN